MNRKKTYNGNLNIGQKTIRIDTNINYQGIEIEYVGTINITSLLPSSYIVKSGNNKVIIIKLIKNDDILSDLFTYKGVAMITKCMIVTQDLETHNIYINKSNLELYNRLDGDYDNISKNWNDLSFDGNNNKKSYIYRKSTLDEENKTFTTIKEIRKK
jgi:hypothetical protein|tara:strand:+ start:3070 stop:3540 length:471 start_codon:yes stop_codon:yes gene_type:complete